MKRIDGLWFKEAIKEMTFERSTEEEFRKVEDLTPRSRNINIIVKAVSKSEIREVVTRRDGSTHRICDAVVGDETASIILSLWDDSIEQVAEEETISIKNGYVSLFRGSMRLNIGRYGSFDKLDEEVISEVNAENNLSEKTYEQYDRQPRFRSAYSDRGSDRRRSFRRSRRS